MLPPYHVGEGILTRADFLNKIARLKKDFALQKKRVFNPELKTMETKEYYNIPAAFDIETTSFYQDGVVKPENKRAIMYHWQIGIWNLVVTGRTWEQFTMFLDAIRALLNLNSYRILIIYVQNLPYEFAFMRKRIAWDKVFMLDSRKPVYAISDGIEFRDMLKLAGGRALKYIAKDLQKYKVEKMTGDLDYNVMRSPFTPLPEKELKYCENDIRVCLCYIQEKIEQDGGIINIPLTNTGYVRKYCRKKCFDKWGRYKKMISQLTIDPDEYKQLQRAFQGGFTHANAHYVQQVMNDISSYDLTSAYPTVMLLERFPMSKSRLITEEFPIEDFDKYLYSYCCLFDIRLTGVRPIKFQDHPISSSKCWKLRGEVLDNGRVVFADELCTTITEQDFFIYEAFYDWDEIEISNLRVYEKDFLPVSFANAVLELYRNKTRLKGVEGEEVEYMISKNMANASYGMTVTNPVRMIYEYKDNRFQEPYLADLEESINKYNKDKKRFLFYPWGVWVTAYCRACLFSAILSVGDDYVYADTDSVKIRNAENHRDYFKRYNQDIEDRIKLVAELRGQEPDVYSPLNRKGVKCTIGLWDYEGTYKKFKTLGAKRYLTQKDDDYVLTVAGTNKVESCKYLVSTGKPFEMFDDNLTIPAEFSGRNVITFIDGETSGWMIDKDGVPYEYEELSSAHLSESDYHLSLSSQFIEYLKGVRNYGE